MNSKRRMAAAYTVAAAVSKDLHYPLRILTLEEEENH
jgi:hypothetical protein